jgi:hypothetical protein
MYLSNPNLSINKQTNYFLQKRNGEEFKHINSSVQVTKCMDYIEALDFYEKKQFKFNKTNSTFRNIKFKNMQDPKDKIKYKKKKIQVTRK